jgi:formamidopyrimidine-DNA glycosylase
MPELPEVETIKNELKPHVVGRTISKVDLLWSGSIMQPSPEEFREGLVGHKILEIVRRGKHLIFKLDNGWSWIAHMRMTGSLLVLPAGAEVKSTVRALIYLDDGQVMHFRDQRKFGRMWLVKDPEEVVGKLGPEPLDESFSTDVLEQILKKRNTPVKGLLLRQTQIAGIGNMYADEALFRARIDPRRPSKSLKKKEVRRLYDGIQYVLKQGIKSKGASVDNYVRPGGTLGTAHDQFQVAHRKGEACSGCGGVVERIRVNQRGTYFCPKCQH